MVTHQKLWLWVWGTPVIISAGITILVSFSLGILLLFCVGASIIGLIVNARQPQPPVPPVPPLRVLGFAFGGGLSMIGLLNLINVMGPVALYFLLLALITSPWTLSFLRRFSARRDNPSEDHKAEAIQGASPAAVLPVVPVPPPAPQESPEPVSESLALLSDAELCRAWRRSYRELGERHTATSLDRLVRRRRAYLDEVERRSPAGLRSWLDSGARASGNPERHLPHRSEVASKHQRKEQP